MYSSVFYPNLENPLEIWLEMLNKSQLGCCVKCTILHLLAAINTSVFMLPCNCSVIYHMWCQNVVRGKKIKAVAGYVTDVLTVPHLASSAIYYPTDAWQCAIYLFYITRNKKCVNDVIILCTCICPPIADKKETIKMCE